jgi:hypothetical protein
MTTHTEVGTVLSDPALDTRQKLRFLSEEYQRVSESLAEVEAAGDAIGTLTRLARAQDRWLDEPENMGAGVVWATETAQLISQLRSLLPDVGPPWIGEYFDGLFAAVPVYVGQVTEVLEAHVRRIDEAGKSDGTVELIVDGRTVSCPGGLLNAGAKKFIQSLEVDGPMQIRLARSSCKSGITSALRTHGFLK